MNLFQVVSYLFIRNQQLIFAPNGAGVRHPLNNPEFVWGSIGLINVLTRRPFYPNVNPPSKCGSLKEGHPETPHFNWCQKAGFKF